MKLQNAHENGNKQAVSKETRDLLDSYLSGVSRFVSTSNPRSMIKEGIRENFKESSEVKAVVKDLQDSPDAVKAVEEKEKDLKKKASSAGLREKFFYTFEHQNSDASPYGLAPVAYGVAAHFFAQVAQTSPNGTTMAVAAGVLGTIAAVKAAKLTAYLASEAHEALGDDRFSEYKRIKQEQFALRLLKRELKKEGTVSGDQHKQQTEAAKKTEKGSFWKGVKELYARFGNPGGGMVHDDQAGKAVSAQIGQRLSAKQSR